MMGGRDEEIEIYQGIVCCSSEGESRIACPCSISAKNIKLFSIEFENFEALSKSRVTRIGKFRLQIYDFLKLSNTEA